MKLTWRGRVLDGKRGGSFGYGQKSAKNADRVFGAAVTDTLGFSSIHWAVFW